MPNSFQANGSDLFIQSFPVSPGFVNPLLLVPGIRSLQDVMRGEEVQIIGCTSVGNAPGQVFLLPGTHSKHVFVSNSAVENFNTYMTGELFALLCQQSMLAGSVESGGQFKDPLMQQYFEQGVEDAANNSLLHQLFMVRTNQLLQGIDRHSNYYYLSGLLIGSEISALRGAGIPVILVCDELSVLYECALRVAGIPLAATESADQALIRGHSLIYQKNHKLLTREQSNKQ